ncbi:MAG: HEAT repeat domain-containing protein [Candidatus Loosdrechtia sp.]|uniref:HEAT repeat domain-containing protein n=1 Tax=Candidatus Loosdrechtia sp. TaxID=3101272 RepID=UPI003A676147|nr:MAG: HEAT repeat domain-containing protein [Candidatus Jettenia sp. AMX2]
MGALIEALKDKDSWVRWNAAVALGEIGDVRAVDALIQAFKDEDSRARERTANALGKIGTLTTLEKLIKDPDLNIFAPEVFSLARSLAVRFRKEKSDFIPVYPELIDKHRKQVLFHIC